MTSVSPPDLSVAFEDDAPAAQERVSAADLDANFLAIEAWCLELLTKLALVIRDDDTLEDYVVRYRNLHPEVFASLTAAMGSVELAVPADGSVTTSKVALLAITTALLNDLAVTTGKIADDAVTAAKIADLAVETAALADLAVTAAKIANGTITNDQIAAGAAIAWSKISKTGAVPGDVGAAAASHGHAASEVTSGTMAQDRLGSGSGGAGAKVLHDDQTWKVPASGGWVTGDIRPYPLLGAVPSGWLECDGNAVDRTTYADLFAALCPSETADQTLINVSADTIETAADTIAQTGVPVRVSSSGSLPTGVSAGTTYYAIKTAANAIALASSLSNAIAGTKVNITATGSGTLTIQYFPWGGGDWSTTFNTPGLARRSLVGSGGTATSTLAACLGATGGAETHTLTTAEMPSHSHTLQKYSGAGSSDGIAVNSSSTAAATAGLVNSTGGGGAHNNMPPSAVTRFLIKT